MGATQMNIYEISFGVKCPNNDVIVEYDLTIESTKMIMVEDILELVQSFQVGYHENMADKLKELGGKQTLVAYHHGVKITTIR